QRVAALVQNCSSEFTVYFLSSAVRCQPLSRALYFIGYWCLIRRKCENQNNFNNFNLNRNFTSAALRVVFGFSFMAHR
ncbi:hypothetical protein EAY18_20335, partial [Vibrio anguillarum]|nr:hypothetical protein [Vibrio anguillarum]